MTVFVSSALNNFVKTPICLPSQFHLKTLTLQSISWIASFYPLEYRLTKEDISSLSLESSISEMHRRGLKLPLSPYPVRDVIVPRYLINIFQKSIKTGEQSRFCDLLPQNFCNFVDRECKCSSNSYLGMLAINFNHSVLLCLWLRRSMYSTILATDWQLQWVAQLYGWAEF